MSPENRLQQQAILFLLSPEITNKRLFFAGYCEGVMRVAHCNVPGAPTREDAPEMEADYDVLIDVELSKLFTQEQWSFPPKAEREMLTGDPLAKGLHAYFSTYTNTF